MSKRDQGALIHEYQENGFLPEAVNNYMALLGWSGKDDQEIFSVAELRERFDLDGVNNSNSKFDFDKIRWVNGEHLRALTPDALASAAAPFLAKAGIDPEDVRVGQALVLAKDRVVTLAEIPGIIVTIFEESVTYDEASLAKVREREDLGVVVDALAKHLAGATPWSVDGIKAAIGEAATSLGLKMGALMLPCRVVVTGSTAGADLVPMMELIGRVEVLRRLVAFEAV